jgi:transposase
MTDDPTPSTAAAGVRAGRRAKREKKVAQRERYFDLMISGYNCNQIARMVRTSAATVRREIDRALAERRLDAPERFASVQVSRLVKALRLAEAAIELGELKAVATYLRVVAALDRYHELVAGSPPTRRPAEPLALPGPPKALTFTTAPINNESLSITDASGVADEIPR